MDVKNEHIYSQLVQVQTSTAPMEITVEEPQ